MRIPTRHHAPERLAGRYSTDQGGAASHARRLARRMQPDACVVGSALRGACRASPLRSGGARPPWFWVGRNALHRCRFSGSSWWSIAVVAAG